MYRGNYLSKENAACLRGLMALVIIMHHWRNDVPFLHGTLPGMMLTAAGYLGVGVFFFLSGYGLRLQGRGYLKTMPGQRILPYYVTYLITVGIYVAAELAAGRRVTLLQWVRTLTWYGTVVDFGWYLQAQLLLYLLFWLVYRKKDRSSNPALVVLLYAAICAPMGDMLWLNAILCFPLGIWWCEHKDLVDMQLENHWLRNLLWVFPVFGVTLLLGNLPLLPTAVMCGMKMLSAVFFVMFVVLFLVKIPLRNPVTQFLGKISGEIYIMQGIGFRLLQGLMENGYYVLQLLGVFAVSIMGGIVLNRVFACVRQWVKRRIECGCLMIDTERET